MAKPKRSLGQAERNKVEMIVTVVSIVGGALFGGVKQILKFKDDASTNAKISDIDSQINNKSRGLGSLFNKKEISALTSQRDDLVNKRHFK